MRVCWNRQTGTFEGRVSKTYGFKSRHSHQQKGLLRQVLLQLYSPSASYIASQLYSVYTELYCALRSLRGEYNYAVRHNITAPQVQYNYHIRQYFTCKKPTATPVAIRSCGIFLCSKKLCVPFFRQFFPARNLIFKVGYPGTRS